MKKTFLCIFVFLISISCANATMIDFNAYTPKLEQNQYEPQGTYGSFTRSADGSELGLTGDIWLNFNILSTITESSILKIDVKNTVGSEILGLQFIDSYSNPIQESGQAFAFAGTQTNFGYQNYRVSGTDWTSFTINIGSYFTGSFEGIVFFVDNDSETSVGEGVFRNVEILASAPAESDPVPEPATMALFGIGLLALAGTIRKRK